MYSKRERPLSGFADLVLLMLERGITISEGKRSFTLSLGDGRPVRQEAKAVPRLVPVPALPGGKARKSARKLKTANASVVAKPAKSAKRAKREAVVPVLPTPLAIFTLLEKNKVRGLKLTDMAKLFELKRNQMKKALQPLLKAGKVDFFDKTKTFLPVGKLRGKGLSAKPGAARKREKPVEASAILDVLKAASQPLDRHAIAAQLKVNYHRLIRRMDALVSENIVKPVGNAFTLP